ncbi:MAG TPA: hypothetical protein DIW47_03770 [Bacteroidetes bacterium]|nr:hypothetical protein [Bacteroidota bacterium]
MEKEIFLLHKYNRFTKFYQLQIGRNNLVIENDQWFSAWYFVSMIKLLQFFKIDAHLNDGLLIDKLLNWVDSTC